MEQEAVPHAVQGPGGGLNGRAAHAERTGDAGRGRGSVRPCEHEAGSVGRLAEGPELTNRCPGWGPWLPCACGKNKNRTPRGF